MTVDQTNNAYIFPGVGLGALAVGARRVSDGMFKAAAGALADVSPAAAIPAPICCRRSPTFAGGVAVAQAVACAARDEGFASRSTTRRSPRSIAAKMWAPHYRPYRLRRRA